MNGRNSKNALLMSGFLFLLAAGDGWHARSVSPSEDRRTSPQSVLNQMYDQYAKAYSYQDTGEVKVSDTQSGTPRVLQTITFKTYFKRPQYFRFEFVVSPTSFFKPEKYAVGFDGKQGYLYSETEGYAKEESLGLAIAGAAGISSGSANTISSLLIEGVGGPILKVLNNITIGPDEEVYGQKCYVIKGEFPEGSVYQLWIGKGDYLLRRSRSSLTRDSAVQITEEDHEIIRLNEDVPLEIFDYKPSVGRRRVK